jgi:hypothetical protein
MDRGCWCGNWRFLFDQLSLENVASQIGLEHTSNIKNMRVVLASILGAIVSSAVNMGILQIFMEVDVKPGQDESAAWLEAVGTFTTVDYLIPLAAHFFGILLGLIVARFICKTSNVPIYIVGGLHMLGVIWGYFWIPAPTWFTIVDFVLPILIIIYFLRTKKKK